MPVVLSPIASEFATQEDANAHEKWFKEQIQKSIDDPRPSVSHDEAMRQVNYQLEQLGVTFAAR